MTGNTMLTVYITNYNYGRFVEQAIESVLSQTFQNFELLIIDDGSTDDSREIISRYEGRENVRIVFQKNKGLNAASNFAVRAARGKYIIRLDADDYFDEHALFVMIDALERSPETALVFPDYYLVNTDGDIIGHERRQSTSDGVTLLDRPAHGACTMFRRDCLLEVGAYDPSFTCQDGYDVWLKIIERYKVKNINLYLFYYRQHGSNLTTNTDRILKTRSEITKKFADLSERPALQTTGILPVRGKAFDPNCLALEMLGGKPLINWTIEAALESEEISQLIVSSPDNALLDNVKDSFGERVSVHKRDAKDAAPNAAHGLSSNNTIRSICGDILPDTVMFLAHETPFISAYYLSKAVNTMRIFDIDMVLGVYPEDDRFFQHDGSGLKPLSQGGYFSSLRHERDFTYRQCAGLSLIKLEMLDNEINYMDLKVGHVVLSKIAATQVKEPVDIKVAELLLAENNTAGLISESK